MKPALAALAALLLPLPLVLCCSGGGTRSPSTPNAAATATADAPALAVDLSPGWSDDDGRRAARELVGGCLGAGWAERIKRRHGRAPALALDQVQNRSSEHVNTRMIARQLRAALTAGARGRIQLVAEGQPGDLLLLARLASQDDASASTTLKALLLSLMLVDASSAEVLWADGFVVRKLATRAPPARQGDPPGPLQVQLLAPDQTVDVSGAFNDYDAATLTRSAVKDLTGSAWLRDAAAGTVVLRIYPLQNRTSELIRGDFFALPLTRALVRHGGARVVAPLDQARLLRARRAAAAADAGPPPGQELAATHVISLQLTAATEARSGVSLTRYTLAASAVSVDDNRTVWSFSRSIQKVLNQAPAGATVR